MAKKKELIDVSKAKISKEERYTQPATSEYTIIVDDFICYLRKPNRKDISMALPMFMGKQKDLIGAGELILRQCFMIGDDEFLKDDEVIMAAAIQCASLVKFREAELKKN